MKKLMLIMLAMFIFGACQNKKEEVIEPPMIEEPDNNAGKENLMGSFSFDERDLKIVLDLSGGTGFEWFPIYMSDNVEVKSESQYDNGTEEEPIDGGPGEATISCHINGNEDALVILKSARPWEPDGSYQAYFIKMEDEKIADVKVKYNNQFADMEFAHGHFSDDDWIGFNMPKDWEYETVEKDDRHGFYLKPENEKGRMELLRYPDYDGESEKSILIKEKEYKVAYDDDGRIKCLWGADDMCCLLEEAKWADEYFYLIVEILDNVRFE